MILQALILPIALMVQQQAQRVTPVAQAQLTLKADGAKELKLGYMPIRTELSETKPEGVIKEPTYAGKPRYAVIKLGSGPKAGHVVVVDEPAGGEFKMYFDANGNGDLTDDGDGKWTKKNEAQERTVYGTNSFVAKATYGGRNNQETTADYGLALYRIVSSSVDTLLYYREAARMGELKLGEKTYKVTLVENDADGLYNKRLNDDGKSVNQRGELLPEKTVQRPVWLILEGDDKKKQTIEARAPFELDGKVYEARISANGERLGLIPSERKPLKVAAAAPRRPLLTTGTPAPDFTVYTLEGKPLKLSDLKGKVVVMDFWATWCGPCMQTMPHIEKTWQKIKERSDVTVIGVCVWDEKAAYDKWVPANKAKFSFPLLFDVAAKDNAMSIASKLFNVSGIPTTYIIDKDGNVAATFVGSKDIPEGVEPALKKLGISLD